MSSRWLLIVVAAMSCVGCAGCDDDRPLIPDSPNVGIVYDTKYEDTLNSGKSLPLLEQAWRPYVEVFDEPAAVVGWRDGVSTWEIFYATNRDVLPESVAASRERYGNVALSQARFGRAEVRVPKRLRGVDPKRADEATPSDDAVALEQVRGADWSTFVAGVDDQLRRSRQKDLLLFVHGFNVDFDEAVIRTAQIALDMPFNGAVVAYAWPSQGGVANYRADEPINAASVAPFAEFLAHLVSSVPPETRVNVVVHSMGNRIVMQGIGRLPSRPGGAKPSAHVALCARRRSTRFRRRAPGVVARSERVTLYASAGDAALVASQALHQEPRAGNVRPPLVVDGVETIDCSAVDFDFMGHGYYGGNVDVLGDLFAAIKQRHTADQRVYLTKKTLPDGGDYWHYRAHAPRMLWTWNFDESTMRR
ncbi:MAG: alpha/beta hydrolase [Pirellulales bacterium]